MFSSIFDKSPMTEQGNLIASETVHRKLQALETAIHEAAAKNNDEIVRWLRPVKDDFRAGWLAIHENVSGNAVGRFIKSLQAKLIDPFTSKASNGFSDSELKALLLDKCHIWGLGTENIYIGDLAKSSMLPQPVTLFPVHFHADISTGATIGGQTEFVVAHHDSVGYRFVSSSAASVQEFANYCQQAFEKGPR